jgi:hypothetical protein
MDDEEVTRENMEQYPYDDPRVQALLYRGRGRGRGRRGRRGGGDGGGRGRSRGDGGATTADTGAALTANTVLVWPAGVVRTSDGSTASEGESREIYLFLLRTVPLSTVLKYMYTVLKYHGVLYM